MNHADPRPRVHITPTGEWSFGPTTTPHPAATPGDALNRALEVLGERARRGVVVIVESGL